jgi:hypothetical protein
MLYWPWRVRVRRTLRRIVGVNAPEPAQVAHMTRTTNARIAGVTYLLYIVLGLGAVFVSRGASAGEGIAARLANIAQHATELRISMLLGLLTSFTALTLAVALYGITRDDDHELSVMALCCRVAEGVVGVIPSVATLGLLWLGTSDASAPDAEGAYAVAGFLLKVKGWNPTLTATFFAVGSTIFSWLLLRGRMVPCCWRGLASSHPSCWWRCFPCSSSDSPAERPS